MARRRNKGKKNKGKKGKKSRSTDSSGAHTKRDRPMSNAPGVDETESVADAANAKAKTGVAEAKADAAEAKADAKSADGPNAPAASADADAKQAEAAEDGPEQAKGDGSNPGPSDSADAKDAAKAVDFDAALLNTATGYKPAWEIASEDAPWQSAQSEPIAPMDASSETLLPSVPVPPLPTTKVGRSTVAVIVLMIVAIGAGLLVSASGSEPTPDAAPDSASSGGHGD